METNTYLQNLKAVPHPNGNRIELTWVWPATDHYPQGRLILIRREDTYPTSPTDRFLINSLAVKKLAVSEETAVITDYSLKGETTYYYTLFLLDENNVVVEQASTAAMATAPYDMSGQMYELLPRIYHRYDTASVSSSDKLKGQLRRFLDLPAGQLDLLHSYAKATLDLYNLDKVDGRLLPLLAQWLGWQTDYRQGFDRQRNEIRNAPYLYKTIGIIAAVEATIKRVLGRESRTKEFLHNVFLSNRPERLNFWIKPGIESPELFSLDFAYEGRPAVVYQNTKVWLFYHTLRNSRWQIWYKVGELNTEVVQKSYVWSPSQPLTEESNCHYKYPTAVVWQNKLWVFWEAYNELEQRAWQILYRYQEVDKGTWSQILVLGTPSQSPRQIFAVLDEGKLQLFFASDGQLKGYQPQYIDNTEEIFLLLGLETTFIDAPIKDLFILPNNGTLWFFGARYYSSQWQLVYWFKQNSSWSSITPLSTSAGAEREPAALFTLEGHIALFWSAFHEGSWSIWRAIFDINTHQLGNPERLTDSPYSQREPVPIADNQWIFRSNQSLSYQNTVYRATQTIDHRYAGCTTVDSGNLAKINLRNQFEDFQTYTVDTANQDEDWYAQGVIGIYLKSTSEEDQKAIIQDQELIKKAIKPFLPIQVRPTFFTERVTTESVYTVEQPLIEQFFDKIDTVYLENPLTVTDRYRDTILGWSWLYSWSAEHNNQPIVKIEGTTAKNTAFKTWHIGLTLGE